MNCSKCNNLIPEGAKFCGKCGIKAVIDSEPVNRLKDKTIRVTRIVCGLSIGLATFAISFKIIFFIFSIISVLGLGAFDLHVSDDARLLRDVEAFANIFGFVGSLILANMLYKRITKKNIDPNKSIKSFKMSQ